MKKLNKLGKVALLAVLAVALSITACKQKFDTSRVVVVIGVTLDKTTAEVEVGKTVTLKATVAPANATNQGVTWTSDKTDIATVTDGVVTGVKAGTAKITVTTKDGGKTASCTVTVKTATYAVNFSVDGGNGSLKATVDGTEISTGTKVAHGKEVIFTATPNDGYGVDNWFGGVTITSNNTATLTVIGEVVVKVKFIKIQYNKTENGDYFDLTGIGVPTFKMKKIVAVTNGTIGRDDQYNNKQHQVSLSEYYIGETEVTQELYKAIMGNNPSYFQGSENPPETGEVQEKRPVEWVNWYEAVAFCNELTKAVADLGVAQCVYYSDAGKTNVYTKINAKNEDLPYMDMDKKGFRLPTEAEWEWAAQGGSASEKYAGTSDESKLGEYAWYDDNAGDKTHEVGKKNQNSFDLYDMSGNVLEWCWDWWSSNTPTGGDNPTGGAGSGSDRVYRGGSWDGDVSHCVVGFRYKLYPDNGFSILGFRLAWRP